MGRFDPSGLSKPQTSEELQKYIQSTPPELDSLYQRLMSQIKDTMNDESVIQRFILCSLLKVDRPLDLSEIHAILEDQFGPRRWSQGIEAITKGCGGFVEIDSSGQARLIHQTAKAYLKSTIFQNDTRDGWSQSLMEQKNDSSEPIKSTEFRTSVIDNANKIAVQNSQSTSSARLRSNMLTVLEAVIHQFASSFANEKNLRPAILECLEKNGLDDFQLALSRLLRKYSKDLQQIVRMPVEQFVAGMVGGEILFIAQEVVVKLCSLDDVKLLPCGIKDDEKISKATVLDRFLGDNDKGKAPERVVPSDKIVSAGQDSWDNLMKPLLQY